MQKDIFDIIYLLDKEIGIQSIHMEERPCLIVDIDIDSGEGWIIPLSSKRFNNKNQYYLSFGSWIDFSQEPIKINDSKLKYSSLADLKMSTEDLEELEDKIPWYIEKF